GAGQGARGRAGGPGRTGAYTYRLERTRFAQPPQAVALGRSIWPAVCGPVPPAARLLGPIGPRDSASLFAWTQAHGRAGRRPGIRRTCLANAMLGRGYSELLRRRGPPQWLFRR